VDAQFTVGTVCITGCDPVDATHVTRFEIIDNDRLADGTAQDTAMAYAYDFFGNPVEGAEVIVIDATTGDLAGYLTPDTATVTTGVDGTVMVSWTSTTPGTFAATGTIDGVEPAVSDLDQIRFTSGDADPSISQMVVSPPSPQVVGTDYTVTVTVRDASGHPLEGEAVSFSLNPATPAQVSDPSCTTVADGTCSVTVSSVLVAEVEIHAMVSDGTGPIEVGGNGDSSKSSPQSVEWFADTVCVSSCDPVDTTHVTRVEVFVDGVEANGSSGNLARAYAYDQYGNPVPGAVVTSSTLDTDLTIVTPIPVTDANGESVIEYRSTVAGSYTAEVRIDAIIPARAISSDGSQTDTGVITLNFHAGTVDPDQSYLEIDPTTSQVVGSDFTVTAYVVDPHGNPVDNTVVTFPPVTDLDFSAPGCTTDATGTCEVTVSSTIAGTYTISGLLGTDVLSNEVEAQFTAGTVCVTGCDPVDTTHVTRFEMVDNDSAADGVSENSAITYAYDQYGNPVADAEVIITNTTTGSLAGYLTPEVHSVRTGPDGTVMVAWTSTMHGTHSARGTVNGVEPAASDLDQIRFVPGDADPSASSLVITPSSPRTVGTAYTATVTVRDAAGHGIAGETVEFSVVPSSPAMLSQASCVTLTDGSCSITVSSMLVTQVGLHAMLVTPSGAVAVGGNSDPAQGSPQTIAWIADGVCVTGCTPVDPDHVTRFEMVDNDRLADGVAQNSVRAYAYDQYGNPVNNAEVIVTDTTTGALAGYLTPATASVLTGADGTVMVYWRSTQAGAFTALGTIAGSEPATGGLNQIRFTNGDADPSSSQLVITPESPRVAGANYVATVIVRDSSGHGLVGETVSFWLTPSSPASLSQATCVTQNDGSCSVLVSSKLVTEVSIHAGVSAGAGPVEVSGDGDPDQASPQTVAWIADEICVTGCTPVDPTHETRVEVFTDGAQANGSSANLARVYAYDQFGNPVPGLPVSSTSTDASLVILSPIPLTDAQGQSVIEYRSLVAGAHPAEVRIDSQIPARAINSDGSQTTTGVITVNFSTGTADPSRSYLVIDPPSPQLVGFIFTLTAYVVDAGGNPVNGSVVSFAVVANLEFSATACTTDGSGSCQVSATSKIAAIYTVSGSINLEPLSNTVTAEFTPGAVCFDSCSPVDGANYTHVDMVRNYAAADGIAQTLAVAYAFDYFGNPVVGSVVTSNPVAGTTGLSVQSDIAPINAAGMTEIWYTSNTAGVYRADVRIGGVALEGSPVMMVFGCCNVDFDESTWMITPPGPLNVGWNPANMFTAVASVNDVLGNPVEGIVVNFALDSTAARFQPESSCTTDDTGSCSVRIQSTVAGTYSVTASLMGEAMRVTGTTNYSASIKWVPEGVCIVEIGCIPFQNLITHVGMLENDEPVGTGVNMIAFYAFDRFGNVVENVPFVFSTTDRDLNLGGFTYSPQIEMKTGVDGMGFLPARSEVPGNHYAHGFVNATELTLNGSPLEIRFLASPTILGPRDGVILDTGTFVIAGTGQTPGDIITVWNGTGEICTTVVQADLSWSCTVHLAGGAHSIVATESVLNGDKDKVSIPSFVVHIFVPLSPSEIPNSSTPKVPTGGMSIVGRARV